MAVIKSSSRRPHRDAMPVSWPNNIPRNRRGSGYRTRTPGSRLNHPVSSHRTYHAKPASARPHIPGRASSARVFRRVNPPTRPIRRTTVPRNRSKSAPRQKANTAKQTLKKTRDDSEGKLPSTPIDYLKLISIPPDSFDKALKTYTNAYEKRLLDLRKWVNQKHAEHRIDFGVKKELNAYFGKRKFGDRPSAKVLSKYACQALELSEHDLGTDMAWAKNQTWRFGQRWGSVFEKMIAERMGKDDYGVCGPGYVGEEDVESWAAESEYWEGERRDEMGDGQGDVDGLGEDVDRLEEEVIQDVEDGEYSLDWERTDNVDADEAEGLRYLDDMGNVPMDENPHGLDEQMDIETNLDL